MGLQQTYGGVARAIAPLFFGWSFDKLGVSSPYFIASAIIMATILLGLGLDQYDKEAQEAQKAQKYVTMGTCAFNLPIRLVLIVPFALCGLR
jgi:hypothetical protein